MKAKAAAKRLRKIQEQLEDIVVRLGDVNAEELSLEMVLELGQMQKQAGDIAKRLEGK